MGLKEISVIAFYENWEFWTGVLSIIVTVGLGLAVWCSTKKFNSNQLKISNDQLQKELFKEFNERYDKLNNKIDIITKIRKEDWKKLKKKEKNELYAVIIDYLNICAEEYFWKEEGRINPKIWASWEKGMNDNYNKSELIQSIWEKECEKEGYKSYYIDRPDAFFKKR